MLALSQGIIEGDFFRSLAKKHLASYDDFLGMTDKYINIEEAQRIRKIEFDSACLGTSQPERKAPPSFLEMSFQSRSLIMGQASR